MKLLCYLILLLLSTWELTQATEQRNLLITGCARSGTMYIATLLQESGLDVKHEWLGDYGCSSWIMNFNAEVTPYGQARNGAFFVHTFHQVRHPLKVISSVYSTEPEESWQYIIKNIPQIRQTDSHLVKCAKYWFYGNLRAQKQAEWTYRIEDIENVWDEFQKRLGVTLDCSAFERVPKNTNTRPHTFNFTWKDLKENLDLELYLKIYGLAKHYGY